MEGFFRHDVRYLLDARRILLLWAPPIIAALDLVLGVVILLAGYSLGAAVIIMSVGIVIGWDEILGVVEVLVQPKRHRTACDSGGVR